MRIGVTMFRDNISPRLDISDSLLIYEIKNCQIKQKEKINLIYDQPGQLLTIFEKKKIDLIMCNSCPGYFSRMISANDKKIVSNVSGNPDEIVKMFINKKLQNSESHESFAYTESRKRNNKFKNNK